MAKEQHVEGYGVPMWAIKTADDRLCRVMTYREDLEENLRLNREMYGPDARVVSVVVVETN
jgi:predicted butyrate kinase (DUF1464 family)